MFVLPRLYMCFSSSERAQFRRHSAECTKVLSVYNSCETMSHWQSILVPKGLVGLQVHQTFVNLRFSGFRYASFQVNVHNFGVVLPTAPRCCRCTRSVKQCHIVSQFSSRRGQLHYYCTKKLQMFVLPALHMLWFKRSISLTFCRGHQGVVGVQRV